jgi:hypothetical protein
VRVQFDIHSPATTVREALAFSAELRLADVQSAQLHSFVDEVGRLPLFPQELTTSWQVMLFTFLHSIVQSGPELYGLHDIFSF